MRRPQLHHLIAIKTDDSINIRTFVTLKEKKQKNLDRDNFPLKNLYLFSSHQFSIHLDFYNNKHELLFSNGYTSDHFGNFNIRIPIIKNSSNSLATIVQIYETSSHNGIKLLMGSFLLTTLSGPCKIIISDLDKTLVETKSSSPKDIFKSLTTPISSYPTINSGIALIKEHIKNDFYPFIVSSSPHFYEETIRNWLYQKKFIMQVFSLRIIAKF